MPGRFAQSYWISLAGSVDDVHEIDVALSGAAVVFGSFWVRSVKKLRCSQKQFVVLQERVGFLRFLVIS